MTQEDEVYKMIPVKEGTKAKLGKMKSDVGNPPWDAIINDYIEILQEENISERGDLANLKKEILEWLNNGRKKE